MNFKCNINVKAMTSREDQKGFVSNPLVSIKYLVVAWSTLVLLILSKSSLPYKRISVSWSLLKSEILGTMQLAVFKGVTLFCKQTVKKVMTLLTILVKATLTGFPDYSKAVKLIVISLSSSPSSPEISLSWSAACITWPSKSGPPHKENCFFEGGDSSKSFKNFLKFESPLY